MPVTGSITAICAMVAYVRMSRNCRHAVARMSIGSYSPPCSAAGGSATTWFSHVGEGDVRVAVTVELAGHSASPAAASMTSSAGADRDHRSLGRRYDPRGSRRGSRPWSERSNEFARSRREPPYALPPTCCETCRHRSHRETAGTMTGRVSLMRRGAVLPCQISSASICRGLLHKWLPACA
jgi:hypothetical protein